MILAKYLYQYNEKVYVVESFGRYIPKLIKSKHSGIYFLLMKRMFIALNLSEKVRDCLVLVQDKLRREVGEKSVKWVERENLHVCLFFLEEVEDEKIAAIKNVLNVFNPPFQLSLSKLGFFPNKSKPRVVWVGLSGEIEGLVAYRKEVKEKLLKIGLFFDPRFSAHITLGRIRRKARGTTFSQEIINRIQELLEKEKISFTTNKVSLFEVKLSSEGPKYFPVFEVKLAA